MSVDLYHAITHKAGISKILDFLPYPFIISEFRNDTFCNIHANKKFREEIGYSLEDIPTIDDWFRLAYPEPNYRNEVMTAWYERTARARHEGQDSALMRVIIRTRKQGNQWYEVKCSTHEPLQMIAFVNIEDVMAKEEELERLNRNHNRVLSILAHDLRSPITNLHSMVHLLMGGNLSPSEFMAKIGHMYEKSTQLLEFIDTTLLWTRSNFDEIQVKRESVDIREIVQSILSVYEIAYQRKNINVIVDLHDLIVSTDPQIVTILLRNIISNAIKFTANHGTILIQGNAASEYTTVSVIDSGVGMTQETIDKIFSDNAISSRGTSEEKGLGIGLKLCRQLIRRLNGTLEINSAPGEGSRIKLTLR